MPFWADLDLNQLLNLAHPLNRGRVAWWLARPLVYGTNDWPDLVQGYNGALTSFASGYGWNTASNPGGAGSIRWNGSAGKLSAADVPALHFGTGSFSVACWILGASISGSNYAIIKGATGTGPGWYLRGTGTPSVGFLYGDGTHTGNAISGTTLATNTWYRVIALFRRSVPQAELWINGVLNNYNGIGTIGSVDSSTPLYLGSNNGSSGWWNGNINDVSVWNRALSAQEVLADYWLSQQGYPDVLNFAEEGAVDLLFPGVTPYFLPRNLVTRPRFEPAYFE